MLGGLAHSAQRSSIKKQAAQHHRFRFACAVVPVSVRGAGAPRTGAEELHRQCFASVGQCAGAQIWPRLAYASCWISRRLRLGLAAVFAAVVAHARYGHPLRFYITPHFGKCSPVVSLKLHLVSPTASRPYGFPKQALCKVAFAGVGRTAVGASRSHPRPTRRRLRALVAVVAPGHWSGAARFVLVSGLRPVTGVVLPRPPAGPRRCAALAPAPAARPPPRGLPQPASLLDWFSYTFSSKSRTGFVGTGLAACKPA